MKQEKWLKYLNVVGIFIIVICVILGIQIIINLLSDPEWIDYDFDRSLKFIFVLDVICGFIGFGFCCISRMFASFLHSHDNEKYREEYIKNQKTPHSYL